MNKIKELSLGEILDHSIKVYQANFWPLIAISSLTLLPAFMMIAAMPQGFGRLPNGMPTPESLPLILGSTAAYIFIYVFAYGAMTQAIADAYLGGGIQLNDAFRLGRARFLALFGTGILAAVGIGFASLFLIIPGIYVAVFYTFAVQAVVLERLSGFSALRRSRSLIKGAWWRVAGIIFVLNLLAWVIQFALSLPAFAIGGVGAVSPALAPILTIVSQALQQVVSVVVSPLLMIGTTLLYFDQRVRREGFDLWLAAEKEEEPVGEPI